MIDSITDQPAMSIQGHMENDGNQSKSRIPNTVAQPSKPLVQSREQKRDLKRTNKPDLLGNEDLFDDAAQARGQTAGQPQRDKEDLFSDDIFGHVASTSKSQSSQKSSSKSADNITERVDPLTSSTEQEATDKVSSWLQTSDDASQRSLDNKDDDIFTSQKGTASKQTTNQQTTPNESRNNAPSTKSESKSQVSIKSESPPSLDKASSNENTDPTGVPPPLKVSSVEGDFEDEEQDKPDLFANNAVLDNEDVEDLFNSKKSKSTTKKDDKNVLTSNQPQSTIKADSKIKPTVTDDDDDDDDDDDLFSFTKKATSSKSKPPTFGIDDDDDDIFGNSSILTKPVSRAKTRAADNIFDDILKPHGVDTKIPTSAVPSEDPLITEPNEGSTPALSKPSQASNDDDIFGDSFLSNTAVAGSSKTSRKEAIGSETKKSQKTGVQDADDDDIFADIPISKPKGE